MASFFLGLMLYNLSTNLTIEQTKRVVKTFNSYLEIQSPSGQNKVIIAHSFPKDISLGQIPDMGTVIIEPLGQGKGYNLISRVTLREWNEILERIQRY